MTKDELNKILTEYIKDAEMQSYLYDNGPWCEINSKYLIEFLIEKGVLTVE